MDFIDLVRRTMGPAISVNIELAPDLWPALVDANQLENALLNLCINARDAMPDGGQLSICTGNVTLDEEGARKRGLVPSDYVTITVGDTGVGIPPEDLDRVFEPFFTTKPTGKGTGLGLSMVYGFARQSNGLVRIRSTPGLGTQVRIYLPRHDGCAEASPEESVVGAPDRQIGATVLVVDDEPTVRMMMIDGLQLIGIECIEAADGASALAMLDGNPAIDLLITDVGLPGGLNGRQVADEARRRIPALGVLFVTGYADSVVLQKGSEIELRTDVLTKPFLIDDLQRRAASLIAAGTTKSHGQFSPA
jgi:CheY-like chemotaxis protein